MRRLIPDTIAGRTLLVLLLGLAVSHGLSVALYFTDRANALAIAGEEHVGERIVTVLRLIENAPKAERMRLVQLADNPELRVTWSVESALSDQRESNWQSGVLRDALDAHLASLGKRNFIIRYVDRDLERGESWLSTKSAGAPREGKTILVSLQLPDETWLNFTAPVEPAEAFWSVRLILSMVVMLAGVLVLSAVVVHHLIAPLRVFGLAAERLGVDVHAPPLKEAGPREVRRATRAFNEMQRRIRRFIDDRTRMLAAISHDLRTPITRMRLRAEFVEDEEEQRKMFADLDEMQTMISSLLSFAREDVSDEPREVVDLVALIESVCHNLADLGYPVEFAGEGRLAYACRRVALRRALTNLVENAVKYGERARVGLNERDDHIIIHIDDDGPGIPVSEVEKVFAAFYRVEQSRNRATGGVGVGLYVARTIIRGHGGEVKLENRTDGGLRVVVTLPR